MNLYANLMDVAICGILTYFVNRHHKYFDNVFASASEYSAVYAWLHFTATINHNNSLCQDNNPQVRTLIIILFRCVCPTMSANNLHTQNYHEFSIQN